ncbi:hypothetical protein BKA66DRAFT_448260 [Pyrenochaeta sp. MPI-SDFR-AT-0127]|nr:hypothetical protein BKA66DRAFT_448260 [Pyrenochaeta sp. MPI-SDFR-AT-0127]
MVRMWRTHICLVFDRQDIILSRPEVLNRCSTHANPPFAILRLAADLLKSFSFQLWMQTTAASSPLLIALEAVNLPVDKSFHRSFKLQGGLDYVIGHIPLCIILFEIPPPHELLPRRWAVLIPQRHLASRLQGAISSILCLALSASSYEHLGPDSEDRSTDEVKNMNNAT